MARLGQRPIIVRAARAAQRATHEQDRQQHETGERQEDSGFHGGPFSVDEVRNHYKKVPDPIRKRAVAVREGEGAVAFIPVPPGHRPLTAKHC